MLIRLAVAALLCLFPLAAGGAAPSRIIILRHGEKADAWMLCGVGQERADALAAFYLGRHAAKSLFAQGEEPAAFLAITCIPSSLSHPPLRAGESRSRFIPWCRTGRCPRTRTPSKWHSTAARKRPPTTS